MENQGLMMGLITKRRINMLKINLGGTCGGSNWRDILISMLTKEVLYRNPVVENDTWTYSKKIQEEKRTIMQECDYLLYVITPEQKGFSAIASAIDYSNKTPERVLFCVLYEWGDKKFEGHPLESINCVKDMIKDNGGKIFENLEQIADFLNSQC